ncbi:MAG: antitoxin family protein [Nitrospirota bacterium]
MSKSLKAIYRRGAFIPETPCNLPEESEVELIVQGPVLTQPEIIDPQERASILGGLVARMQQNMIPQTAPRFTRESLHERS